MICFPSIPEDVSPCAVTTGRGVVESSQEKGGIMRTNACRLALWIALALLAAVPAGAANDVRYAVPAGDSPSIGPGNAPVTIVEFVDYQ